MTQISKQALLVENNQSFPNNNNGAITPSELRGYNIDVIDSTVNQTVYTTDSGSWNQQIDALEVFTASQQPSFTALNSFTASQLVINSGVNTYTQSANSRLTTLETETANLETFTASVNEIRDDGVLQGYSTRFFFNGLVSASIVSNVGGAIANVTIQQDGTKLNTSSFDAFSSSLAETNTFTASAKISINSLNAFTASTNQRVSSLETNSASVNISIAALNNYSTSVGPVATGSLVTTSSFSGTSITFTKGNGTTYTNVGIQNTASFNEYTSSVNTTTASLNTSVSNLNSFTASQLIINSGYNTFTSSANQRLNSIESVSGSWITESETGSFARTGSNVFSGSQTITGSVYGNLTTLSIVASTASIDMSAGNLFTLTLSGSSTHLNATNIRPGQTLNLLVTNNAAGTGTLTLAPKFKQPAGFVYVASPSASAQDILTFVTFASTASIFTLNAKSFV